jgi:hypothetical protein
MVPILKLEDCTAAASIAMFVNPAHDYYAEIDTRGVAAAARAC